MLPHQPNFPGPALPTFERSISYVPKLSSSPRFQSRSFSPSSLIARSERATPTERNKNISSATGHPMPDPSMVSSGSQNTFDSTNAARSVVPLTFDQVLSKLKPLLDGTTAGERKILIEGVSADILNKLREKGTTSELSGWEKLSIDFFGEGLIVQYPTFGHEILSSLFFSLDFKDSEGNSLFNVGTSRIRLGGSTDVDLVDGAVKSPDFSIYEDPSTTKPMTEGMPTVVWEVAYSQDEKKLAYVLGKFVACSLGSVRLAIGVNIEHNSAVEGQPRSLKKVTCAFWEAEYTESFDTFEESGLKRLGVLERSDDFASMNDDFVVPAARKFSFVSEFGGEYIKFVVSQCKLYTIYPEDPSGPTEMHILKRHLYRGPLDDEDEPALTIPFPEFLKVIFAHEKQHSKMQLRRSIMKRPLDGGDPTDKKNKEDIAADIARLKRRRVA